MTFPAHTDGRTRRHTTVSVLVAAFVLTAASCSGDDVEPATTAAALTTVDEFFIAFNAGDDEAATALLTTDTIDSFGPTDAASELAWFTSQGTVLGSVSCELADEQTTDRTVVTCDHETLDALTQAVDALPVPTTTTFTVTASGISDIHFGYGRPDFTHVGFPFQDWLAANRPEVNCLAWYADDGSCTDTTSVEEDREAGRLVARYAQEWAEYLESKSCGYLDGC